MGVGGRECPRFGFDCEGAGFLVGVCPRVSARVLYSIWLLLSGVVVCGGGWGLA